MSFGNSNSNSATKARVSPGSVLKNKSVNISDISMSMDAGVAKPKTLIKTGRSSTGSADSVGSGSTKGSKSSTGSKKRKAKGGNNVSSDFDFGGSQEDEPVEKAAVAGMGAKKKTAAKKGGAKKAKRTFKGQ